MKWFRISPSFFSLYFVIFMDNFGFSILFCLLGPLILLPEYQMVNGTLSLAAKNTILALTFGVFPLTQFLGAPLIGDFADHFGRKTALYLTIIGVTIGYLFSAGAIAIHSVTLFIISRLLSGFFAGNLSVCLAAIADLSPDEKTRGKNFSNVVTLFGASWILAMITGGYFANPRLIGPFAPVLAFLITAGLSVLNFFAIWAFFKESHKKGTDFRFDLFKCVKNILYIAKLPSVRWFFLAYFFWVVGWGMSLQWFPPYSIEIYNSSVEDVTSWMIILGLTWILGGTIINRYLLGKYNSLKISLIGIVFTTGFVFIAQFIPWHPLFAFLYCIAAISSAFTMSNITNLISLSASEQVQGKTMGLSQSVMAFGWIASAIIAAIINRENIGFMYIFCAMMLVITTLIIAGKFLHQKKMG